MAFKFNGTTIASNYDVKFNGTSLKKIVFNGTTVWQKIEYIFNNGGLSSFNSNWETYYGIVNKSESSGDVSLTFGTIDYQYHSFIGTINKIKIPTGAKKLNIKYTATDSNRGLCIGTTKTHDTGTYTAKVDLKQSSSFITTSLDVSKYAGGSYYIYIFGASNSVLKIDSIWFEF